MATQQPPHYIRKPTSAMQLNLLRNANAIGALPTQGERTALTTMILSTIVKAPLMKTALMKILRLL
jgi:hypothetical protein